MQTNNCGIANKTANMQKVQPLCIEQMQMVVVGKFGKSIGLKGGMRISILTDFPEILCKNTSFYIPYTKHILPLAHIFDTTSININKTAKEIKSTKTLNNSTSENIENIPSHLKKSYYFPITLHSFNDSNNVIQFSEITRREESMVLCNMLFYSTIDDTRKLCKLSKDEFFYFDIIGMSIVENGVEIGIVRDIQEIANTHYFVLDKHFMIPYIDRYVLSINLKDRQIVTQDARFLRTES